jgi:uncharacterized protein (DUF2225 family)
MTTWYDVVLVCPKCDTTFKGTSIGSCGYAGKDSDFYPQYWGANPLPHFVKVCPSCNHGDHPSKFKPGTPGPEVPREEALPCWRRYELVAETHRQEGVPPFSLAQTLHRAAWGARAVDGDKAKELEFLQQARELFEQALGEDGVPTEPDDLRPIITYLVGELYRRTGDKAAAVKWFAKVPSMLNGDEKLEWLSKLVESQTALAQESSTEKSTKG